MEERQKHHFIKTVQRPEGWVAMFADAEVLGGEHAVESLRTASKTATFNAVKIREGVHFYSAEQLTRRIGTLKIEGLDRSAAAFERALAAIVTRNAGAPVMPEMQGRVSAMTAPRH